MAINIQQHGQQQIQIYYVIFEKKKYKSEILYRSILGFWRILVAMKSFLELLLLLQNDRKSIEELQGSSIHKTNALRLRITDMELLQSVIDAMNLQVQKLQDAAVEDVLRKDPLVHEDSTAAQPVDAAAGVTGALVPGKESVTEKPAVEATGRHGQGDGPSDSHQLVNGHHSNNQNANHSNQSVDVAEDILQNESNSDLHHKAAFEDVIESSDKLLETVKAMNLENNADPEIQVLSSN